MESDTEYKVYRLISPSGKTYIGITGTSVKKRWSSHVRRAYKEHRNHPLYNAIRKYGPDNFRVEIIETTTDKEEALQLEKYYISIIDEDKKYNISRGG